MAVNLRIGPDAARGPAVEFFLDGRPVRAFQGETIAAASMAAGERTLRATGAQGKPRGYYCGMGVCWECAVWVEGTGIVQACRFPAEQDLQVRRLTGAGFGLARDA